MPNQNDLLKTAGVLLKKEHSRRLELEKLARAQKIAFRKVELGLIEPFSDYESFNKEAQAILAEEDLDLVEKALEYGMSGSHRQGSLEKKADIARPVDILNHFIQTGEIIND